MLLGWTSSGQAIVTDHGCGICALWLLEPGGRKIDPLRTPPLPAPGKLSLSLHSLAAMPRGDWVGLAGEIPALPKTLRGTPCDRPAPDAACFREGQLPSECGGARLERVGDAPDTMLLYWGAQGYPFVQAAGGGRRGGGRRTRRQLAGRWAWSRREAAGGGDHEDDSWRVLYGAQGLWIFDAQSRQRAAWTGSPSRRCPLVAHSRQAVDRGPGASG